MTKQDGLQKVPIKKVMGGFPGGPVVKNPPSNAGDSGSILDQGTKIPNDQGVPKPTHCNLERCN